MELRPAKIQGNLHLPPGLCSWLLPSRCMQHPVVTRAVGLMPGFTGHVALGSHDNSSRHAMRAAHSSAILHIYGPLGPLPHSFPYRTPICWAGAVLRISPAGMECLEASLGAGQQEQLKTYTPSVAATSRVESLPHTHDHAHRRLNSTLSTLSS